MEKLIAIKAKRFHGIDRHRKSSTVSVLNREGVEEKFIGSIKDFGGYVETLGPEDEVAMETGVGSFYWADKIEARGVQCFIIDPYRFRIIDAPAYFRDFYDALKLRRGAGRARIAQILQLCGIMKSMLLNKEEFRHIETVLFEKMRLKYKKELIQIKEERERKNAWLLS